MSFLALLVAVVLEALLPDGFFERLRELVDRFSRECEVDLASLGLNQREHQQWLIPVLMWMIVVYLVHGVLMSTTPLLAAIFTLVLLLYGLRFKHFAEVFTSTQLFLNQGDYFRARELYIHWVKSYDGTEPHVHGPDELVSALIHHGVERALRQYFAVIFWYLIIPDPLGLVAYLAVQWSVIRERQRVSEHGLHLELTSLPELWRTNPTSARWSPRQVQYWMEWLPARLVALTIALVSQFDEVLLAWRNAMLHGRYSNRAPLTAAFLASIGYVGAGAVRHASDGLDEQSANEGQVMALQSFRQLVLKCAAAWLMLVFAMALLGWIPNPLN